MKDCRQHKGRHLTTGHNGWCNRPLLHQARSLFVSSCPPSETCCLLDASAGCRCHLQSGLRSQALEVNLRSPLRQALQAGQACQTGTGWLAAQHDNHTDTSPEVHAALLDSALQQAMCSSCCICKLATAAGEGWGSNPEQDSPLYRRGSLMLSTLCSQLPLEELHTLQTGAACNSTG